MKIGIVGAGFVGATAAYALVMRGVGRQVVLVDRDTDRAAAEADDIRHAAPFAHPLHITAGDYPELAGNTKVRWRLLQSNFDTMTCTPNSAGPRPRINSRLS